MTDQPHPRDRLSLTARGAYDILLSLNPQQDSASVAAIAEHTRSGSSAVSSAVRELREQGFFRTWRERGSGSAPGFIYHWDIHPDGDAPTD